MKQKAQKLYIHQREKKSKKYVKKCARGKGMCNLCCKLKLCNSSKTKWLDFCKVHYKKKNELPKVLHCSFILSHLKFPETVSKINVNTEITPLKQWKLVSMSFRPENLNSLVNRTKQCHMKTQARKACKSYFFVSICKTVCSNDLVKCTV